MMKLYTPIQIEQIQQDIPYLIEITQWVNNFLAKHHPDLGRPGPVCPYVPHSLQSNSIEMAVIRTKHLDLQEIEDIVINYQDIFLKTATKEKKPVINKAFLLIFPDVEIEKATEIIDPIQKKLKPLFIESGLMIGEFHGRTQSSGLHNPNFRPLRSPIPLLAIRFMVEFDLPFLQSPDDLYLRIRYLEAYLKRFGDQLKDKAKLENIYQTLDLAKSQVMSCSSK